MPSSNLEQITTVVEIIRKTNPQSLLDIGIGFGKYGYLAREYLELWDGREKYNDFKKRIDGIEAFPDYITPVHRWVYNNIFVGDALKVVPGLAQDYDLAIMIDSLEHFSRDDGMKLLELLRGKAKNIFVSVPRDMGAQKDAFGNVYETHRYQWQKGDFSAFQDRFFVILKNSLLCFMGPDTRRVYMGLENLDLRNRLLRRFY